MKLHKRLGMSAATIIAVVTISACGGNNGGTPFTSSTGASSNSSSSSSSNSGSAPRVSQPLNVGVLQSNAYAALSPSHVQQLGLTDGTARQTATGPGCSWKYAADDSNRVEIAAHGKNQGGLSDIYDQKTEFEYFEPIMISGYPGVYASASDQRASGTCALHVGVTDQLAVLISTRLASDKATSCKKTEQVADAMIATLKTQ